MDRKAGYKECPRCGLRNKPSALQCDFCGLRFIAGEDWDENIQALEKMGGTDEKVLVDEDISKRIEATIVKREKINASIKAKEPEKDEFDYFKKDPESIKAAAAPVEATPTELVKGPVLEAAPEPRPIVTEATPLSPERIVIPEQPPVEATSPAEPAPEKKVVRRVVKPTSRVFTTAKASRRKSAFAAVLLLGLVWYLVAVMFGGSSLGRAGGWVLVTISTMMVVAGSVELFVPKDGAKMTLVERPSPDSKPQEVADMSEMS